MAAAHSDEDSIGQAICSVADQLQPRAVVLAKHQRGRVAEFFMGSAAKAVATKCRWPVTLLHEEAIPRPRGGSAVSPGGGSSMAKARSEDRITGF